MKDREDDAPPPPKDKPRPSILDLAKKMDAAVRDADAKRQATDAAKAALDACTADYTAAVAVVTDLHAQFEGQMRDVLSFGGTVHVAQ
jgi:hypothetical protein